MKNSMKKKIDNPINISSPKYMYLYSMEVYSNYILTNEKDELERKLEGIENLEFKDYNTWTWIEPLIMLKSRLSSSKEIKEKCKSKIKEVLNIGNDLQVKIKNRIFQRVLKGEELLDDLIKQARQNNDKAIELESIIKSIMQIVTIIEMEASEEFTIKMAEEKLDQLKIDAKKIL